MLSGTNLLHCTYLCFVILLIRPYTTVLVCQIMFILLCSFAQVAQIDIKMLIISYLLLGLLYTFSKAIGEERNSKNNIIYRETQTDSDTYRDKKTQTKTDLEIGTHKYRHTRTYMDSNLDILSHTMLQTDLDRDRHRQSYRLVRTDIYGKKRAQGDTMYRNPLHTVLGLCLGWKGQ